MAERLTPYVQDNIQWEDILPAIIFSINSSVHGSSQYSPFEIVYGHRPAFPLTNITPDVILTDVPVTLHSYMTNFCARLNTIRKAIVANIKRAQSNMEQRKNRVTGELTLTTGDYVYLSVEPTRQGHKLKPIYEGPFVVNEVLSDHMIRLRDPEWKRQFHNPVHINRLKLAHILRLPNPQPYFRRHDDTTDVISEHETVTDVADRQDSRENIDTNQELLSSTANNDQKTNEKIK